MKFFGFLISLLAGVTLAGKSDFDKCHKLPKGGSRRYTTPRTIERGNNQPEAINFLIDNRATLLEMFRRGNKENNVLNNLILNNMHKLSTFSYAVDDIYMGQVFREGKQRFVNMVEEGQKIASKESTEFGQLWRDNTQRLTKTLRDVTYNNAILQKVGMDTDFMMDLQKYAEDDTSEGSQVYRQFINTHGRSFISYIKQNYSDLVKIQQHIQNNLFTVLKDEKLKSGYRQLVNELPLVYQFFNDNIDYIMMANMENSLDEAVAKDIMMEIAKGQDPQIESMINRNAKFIKKLMTQRAEKQMEEKAVAKVMEKNAELKAAAENEAEFNRIVAERKKAGQQITKEMEAEIWNQVKSKNKAAQEEQIGNQLSKKDAKSKPKKGMTRYQHLSAIVSLLPDELLETCADMVMASCPELDLMQIETLQMKAIVEEQPTNFLDQLIQELHDVCEMFGLIDETKINTIMTKNIDGEEIEVDIYADDWMHGEKVQWN